MKLYVLNIIQESADSADDVVSYVEVFSSLEKAQTYLIEFCRENWGTLSTREEEVPTSDADVIRRYFELGENGDYYTITERELDDTTQGRAVEGS